MPTSVKAFFDEKVPAVLSSSPEKVKDVAAVYLFKNQRRRRRNLDGRSRVDAAHLPAGRARDAPVHDRGERQRLPRHDRRRHAGGDVAVLQRQAEGRRRSDAGDQAVEAAAGGRVGPDEHGDAYGNAHASGPRARATLAWGAGVVGLAIAVRLAWVLAVPTVPVSDFAMYRESANYLSEFGHLDPGLHLHARLRGGARVGEERGRRRCSREKMLGVLAGTLGAAGAVRDRARVWSTTTASQPGRTGGDPAGWRRVCPCPHAVAAATALRAVACRRGDVQRGRHGHARRRVAGARARRCW